MNIVETLDEVVEELDKLQDYGNNLNDELSQLDLRRCDLEHFIESNRLTTKNAYRLCKELQNVLKERREIKNNMEISRTLNQYFNRLLSPNSRQFLIHEVKKTAGNLNNPYRNRVYTLEEENYFLDKEGNNEEE